MANICRYIHTSIYTIIYNYLPVNSISNAMKSQSSIDEHTPASIISKSVNSFHIYKVIHVYLFNINIFIYNMCVYLYK